jgi:hypothetical protein
MIKTIKLISIILSLFFGAIGCNKKPTVKKITVNGQFVNPNKSVILEFYSDNTGTITTDNTLIYSPQTLLANNYNGTPIPLTQKVKFKWIALNANQVKIETGTDFKTIDYYDDFLLYDTVMFNKKK